MRFIDVDQLLIVGKNMIEFARWKTKNYFCKGFTFDYWIKGHEGWNKDMAEIFTAIK